MTIDQLAHSWDVGYPLGLDVQLAPELLRASFPLARDFVVRQPGRFGAEVAVPADADEQARWLGFLGRAPDSFRFGTWSVRT